MKKKSKISELYTSFRKLIGIPPKIERVPVVITSYSQPHVLQQRMRQEELSHGETVIANISPVRLEQFSGKMVLHFCPMQAMEITQNIKAGDGGSIPERAVVHGITVPGDMKLGLYTLKHVEIDSNGVINIRSTKETVWERISC